MNAYGVSSTSNTDAVKGDPVAVLRLCCKYERALWRILETDIAINQMKLKRAGKWYNSLEESIVLPVCRALRVKP